ncbi:MAG: ABC transporter permease [Saprospiraceae bacterium]|nr:ABC transporter permease [Saprospiraceae bacterium]MBK7795839.1 ABC transporter permease [Saprospiraceae bacterium]MBK9379363.1 ABC transporter permease [Saprospiraceae bacterium]MBL0260950.1 ABC transporter permease [Saprospiraceae bacterium]
MILPAYIAARYIISKKSSQVINWITGISILGIACGTTALILVLSVFNGFEELLSGMFSKHNPDIKITVVQGRYFEEDKTLLSKITVLDEIQFVSRTLEQTAMFQYGDNQDFGIIKGVDESFHQVCGMDSALIEVSDLPDKDKSDDIYIASGMANKLGVDITNQIEPVRVYCPGLNLENSDWQLSGVPYQAFEPRGVYAFRQDQDANYMICQLDFLRNYLSSPTELSAYEIKLKSSNARHSKTVVTKLNQILGSDYIVKDRMKQDEAFLKIMKLEKWLFFTLFSLTLILVSFTLVGTVWMIVLEKRKDVSILKSLGLDDPYTKQIFLMVGILVTICGIILGFVTSYAFYFLQKKYKLIGVPEEFIIDSYPMQMRFTDFILVALVVLVIGTLATLLPVKKVGEIKAIFRED